MGILVGIVSLTMSGSTAETIMSLLAIGILCMIPLLCFFLPVGFFTAVFRTLAFRDVMIRTAGVRDTVRHTWQVIRRQAGILFILVALLWGVQYGLNLLLGMIEVPLFGFALFPNMMGATAGIEPLTPVSTIVWIITGGVSLLMILLRSWVHAFTAAVWTLAYNDLVTRTTNP